jgi:transcriptional regulator with XRE-family HTH domain
MATALAEVNQRRVWRCDFCLLTQFETKDNNCRRCRRAFDEIAFPEPEPPPVSLAAVVPQATSLAAALSANLRAARLRLGLSQRQLAQRMSVPRTYVSKTENLMATPTLGNLERLAHALQTTIPALLSGGERSREQEVAELLSDPFVAELLPHLPRLSEAQRRAIVVHVHNLTLRRTA